MMHGMGSPDINLLKNIHWLWHAFPGIYVKDLNVYPGYPSQETAMDRQLMRVNQSVVSDPMLHEGFNFYGESQGALLARVYVSELNNPPVHNLIALSGPQGTPSPATATLGCHTLRSLETCSMVKASL